jgi:hypothetical protein
MAEFPVPEEGMLLTHFIVSSDVERSRRFYTEVLGGEAVLEGEPTIVALSNGWVTINVGGRPTTSRQSRSSRPPTWITRAASSMFALRTSMRCTPSGADVEPSS